MLQMLNRGKALLESKARDENDNQEGKGSSLPNDAEEDKEPNLTNEPSQQNFRDSQKQNISVNDECKEIEETYAGQPVKPTPKAKSTSKGKAESKNQNPSKLENK